MTAQPAEKSPRVVAKARLVASAGCASCLDRSRSGGLLGLLGHAEWLVSL